LTPPRWYSIIAARLVESGMLDEQFFKDGEAYERFMGRWSRVVGEVFIEWLSLPEGLCWIDVGCGTGAFAELVLDRCAPSKVSAIDPAEDQIAYASSRPAAARIDYLVGGALVLPYGDREFNVAAMALVISFVPDPRKAIDEMVRVVKPGGTVATYIWDFAGGGFPLKPLFDALETMNITAPLVPGHVNARLDVLSNLFGTAGLSEVATRTIDIEVSYADFDDYWNSQTALGHPAVRIVQEMTDTDVNRLRTHLREHLPTDRNGRIAYPARANAIKGRVPN
jgi:SAM-dependent methyltransferase